jgi:hypothetical protein
MANIKYCKFPDEDRQKTSFSERLWKLCRKRFISGAFLSRFWALFFTFLLYCIPPPIGFELLYTDTLYSTSLSCLFDSIQNFANLKRPLGARVALRTETPKISPCRCGNWTTSQSERVRVQATLQIWIWETAASIPGRVIGHPEFLRNCSQSSQARGGIRLRPLPSKSFPIYRSSADLPFDST